MGIQKKRKPDTMAIYQVWDDREPVGTQTFFPSKEEADIYLSRIGENRREMVHNLVFSKSGICNALNDWAIRWAP